METKIISNPIDISIASEAIRAGGFAAVPTETVYGLCVNALDERAVQALYEIKGRPEVKPLALMIPDAEAMARYGQSIPPAAKKLAERFWPGPLTIIVPAREESRGYCHLPMCAISAPPGACSAVMAGH